MKEKILLFLLCLSFIVMNAQEYKGYDVESAYKKHFFMTPEVASLCFNTLYPVNYSTGAVDIKIPLCEVKCGKLVLPIYITYNSTGIKVNEPVSWVGQNWTLHAEPQICYIPHGNEDNEIPYEFFTD